MNQRKSLDDTCDVFVSRPSIPRWETMMRSPCRFFPGPLERTEPIALPKPSAPSRSLPQPGSSNTEPPKPMRSVNGRHHIPRPRNPFILFRCDLVHQRKMQPKSEADDKNVSRLAGEIWRKMSAEEKRPWLELAVTEKERHALLYPDYKYTPAHGSSKGKKGKNFSPEELRSHEPAHLTAIFCPDAPSYPRGREFLAARARREPSRPRPYPRPLPKRRSSSCPPVGAVPVPALPALESWTPALVTQDDTRRRPSRTVMYQSVSSQPIAEPVLPMPTGHFLDNDWLGSPQAGPWLLNGPDWVRDMSLQSDFNQISNFSFHENIPDFSLGTSQPSFTLDELLRMERLTLGPSFTDPFFSSTITGAPESVYSLPTSISPLDCSDHPGAATGSLLLGNSSPN